MLIPNSDKSSHSYFERDHEMFNHEFSLARESVKYVFLLGVFIFNSSAPALASLISTPTLSSAETIRKTGQDSTRPIGSARMLADRTIVLTLRAETGGVIGDAQFIYKTSDPQYEAISKHIGRMRPGTEKIVLPFPEKK